MLNGSDSSPGQGLPGSRMQDSTDVHVLWIPAIYAGMTCLFECSLSRNRPRARVQRGDSPEQIRSLEAEASIYRAPPPPAPSSRKWADRPAHGSAGHCSRALPAGLWLVACGEGEGAVCAPFLSQRILKSPEGRHRTSLHSLDPAPPARASIGFHRPGRYRLRHSSQCVVPCWRRVCAHALDR
jgi:hypothetical protein